eukprot:3888259-Pyramimonas_sp.AAC.1
MVPNASRVAQFRPIAVISVIQKALSMMALEAQRGAIEGGGCEQQLACRRTYQVHENTPLWRGVSRTWGAPGCDWFLGQGDA